VNLHEKYGKIYRKGWDESRVGRERDPQLMILRGSRGHVYVDGDRLCAAIDSPKVGKCVAALDGVETLSDGDDGRNVRFPDALLPTIAKTCKLYRRRQMTPAAREAAAARLAEYRQPR